MSKSVSTRRDLVSLLAFLIASGSLASLMKVILLVDVFEVSEMRHGSHANQPLVQPKFLKSLSTNHFMFTGTVARGK